MSKKPDFYLGKLLAQIRLEFNSLVGSQIRLKKIANLMLGLYGVNILPFVPFGLCAATAWFAAFAAQFTGKTNYEKEIVCAIYQRNGVEFDGFVYVDCKTANSAEPETPTIDFHL